MKKVILVPRGPKQTTQFPINGNKTIDMKPLYKSFTNPQLYADRLGHNNVEVRTKGTESPFLSVKNRISVDCTGQCKLRSDIVWEEGTQQKICVQLTVDTTEKKIKGSDVNRILDLFFADLKVPELA